MALVQIRDVHKHFTRGSERIDVLKGVNLDIQQGDFLALMGPSGSGKTTLLNLMGGLDTATGGTIEIGGQRIDQLGGGSLARWRSRHIGFVFQLYNLLPVLTAERNVELPLLLTSLGGAERRKRMTRAMMPGGGGASPGSIGTSVPPAHRRRMRPSCSLRSPRLTTASIRPCSRLDSARPKSAGSVSRVVSCTTLGPANESSASGSATTKSPRAAKDAITPPVVGCASTEM